LSGMERFTQRARRVLSLAHQEAERMRHSSIGTEHLLLGLIQEEGGVAGRVLRDLGLDLERVKEVVERMSDAGQYRGGKIDLAPGTQQVLEFAIEEARRMGLVNEVIPEDELSGHVETLARNLIANSPQALAATKRLMAAQNRPWLDAAIGSVLEASSLARETADFREGLAAFLEKRKPEFEGR